MIQTMLLHEKEKFAEIFYRQHRSRLNRVAIKSAFFLLVIGVMAGISIVSFLHATSNAKSTGIPAAVFSVAFLFFAWASYKGFRNQYKARVLPYFEHPLGQNETWLAGEAYLQHSRQLDEIASRNDVRPLSKFASGDDLVRGEVLNWFSPGEALQTVERLLQVDVTSTLPVPVVSDLEKMRDALRLASSKSIKFCFLLREGTSASGMEMERRKGSFF